MTRPSREAPPSAEAFPENTWFFRRVYVYAVTGICLVLELAAIATKAPALGTITIALCTLVGWVAAIYLIAPTREHLARMVSLKDTLTAFWSRGGGMGGYPMGGAYPQADGSQIPPDEAG